jgi:hypothetical protein
VPLEPRARSAADVQIATGVQIAASPDARSR